MTSNDTYILPNGEPWTREGARAQYNEVCQGLEAEQRKQHFAERLRSSAIHERTLAVIEEQGKVQFALDVVKGMGELTPEVRAQIVKTLLTQPDNKHLRMSKGNTRAANEMLK